MKSLGMISGLVCLAVLATSQSSVALMRKKTKTVVSEDRQSAVYKSDASVTGLASDSSSSLFGKTEFTAQAGTAIASGFTAGIFNFKGSYKIPVPALLYGEAGVGINFNTDKVVVPVDFGGRFNIRIKNMSGLQPMAHVSMGPAFASSGKKFNFHMFFGPGVMYRISSQFDLRFDAGMFVFNDTTGFQAVAGVAL